MWSFNFFPKLQHLSFGFLTDLGAVTRWGYLESLLLQKVLTNIPGRYVIDNKYMRFVVLSAYGISDTPPFHRFWNCNVILQFLRMSLFHHFGRVKDQCLYTGCCVKVCRQSRRVVLSMPMECIGKHF